MTVSAGIGFKPQHFEEAIASPADGLWFEVHAENYMLDGSPRLAMLEKLREARPLSIHGVGLSLAGHNRPDPAHLAKLRDLVSRFEPFLVSEHLAWSQLGDTYFPDLLPFPRTNEALEIVGRNIDITQEALGRTILVENPSLYMPLDGHEMEEAEFLATLTERTGCRLLLDINNVHVSANNLGFDPQVYLDALPLEAIREIHLAGYSLDPNLGEALLIDSHDAPISRAVWNLYRGFVRRTGLMPTLIERDGNIPPFSELIAERGVAAGLLSEAIEPAYA